MIEFVPFEPDHLSRVELQPAQIPWANIMISPDTARAVAIAGLAWTAMQGGRVLGCAGFSPQWEGRVVGWALFGTNLPVSAWPRIVRKIIHEFHHSLAAHGRHRVEITVRCDFGAACRLAQLLGFNVEGRMRSYGPDGADHFLCARVIEASPCVR